MVRFFGSPTTEDILKIRDFQDSYFNVAMEHADELLDFQTKAEKDFDRRLKYTKKEKRFKI